MLVTKRLFQVSTATKAVTTDDFYEMYKKSTDEFRSGNLEGSVSLNDEALALATDCAELNWRDVAAVRLNQAHLLKLLGKLDEAKSHAQAALSALDAHFSANKAEVSHALDVLGELCVELGDTANASQYINRSLELKSRLYGSYAHQLAKPYNIRGAINLRENNLKQSRSDFLFALGINVRHLGRSKPLALPIGITLSNIAGVLRKEANETYLFQCISIYRAVISSFENTDPDSWMLGNALADLAECLIDYNTESSQTEAKQLLTRSLTIFLTSRGIDHPSTMRAASLLKECTNMTLTGGSDDIGESSEFVETLLTECESIVPKKEYHVSGDILFLDRRGHVGFGHPHTPLV